ncbi:MULTISPECIES: bifunctional diguanylate cyclase/phosphohydrolase [Paenibacillus]|uniref:Diguanylate cyclase n=1 Tax=Paenibacillus campinasensis TaxID=66347 RepID=A0A268EY89_9BACL|nr:MULTISPECIES: diguanylate cyclase [Paenibacillus]MUG65356.1 diguanylate cyclase [Paenibacillus campinasensis]PAD78087.1 HD family phosphohydrolase [Paenibacillus campinasensis]PAK49539.1 HD family phosphohydrolase [Paenibacillus sp. 7541]
MSILKRPQIAGQLYFVFISLMGCLIFVFMHRGEFLHYTPSQWVWVYAMLGAAMILNYFTFQLPPEGNLQSMDSSIYLACIFIYGAPFALTIILFNTVAMALYDRKIPVWKHFVNFSIYTLMIAGSALIFQAAGGITGPMVNDKFGAYLAALLVYFLINVFLIGFYYYLLYRGSLYDILKNFMKDTLLVYLSTLILSLVLSVLIVHNGIFGLALFIGLSVMLSYSFKQLFSMYNEAQEKAIKDQRTGLYNHSYFESLLDAEIKKATASNTALSLAMIDIDDFKKYNDQFGHLKGDMLLGFLGSFLKKECKVAEVVASRFGGEEFTILMPGYDEKHAGLFINRLRKKLNDTYFDGVEIFPSGCLSFSAGVATYQVDIHDKSQFVDLADQALYYAKKQGKNIVHVYGSASKKESEIDFTEDVRDIEQQLKLFLYKDVDTFKHSKRVFRYAMDMSEVLGLTNTERRNFVLGALIHDIGKLEIPWGILNKKDKLTPAEWETVKRHVSWGKRIAETNDRFKELVPFIELHHERYDGHGYPHGFKGKQIPKLCRMLTIIDSFDAMTTERPYQKTKTFEEGIAELRLCAGTQFDPELVELFIAYIEQRSLERQEPAAGAEV